MRWWHLVGLVLWVVLMIWVFATVDGYTPKSQDPIPEPTVPEDSRPG